ncbi:MAG: M23 family metallopeptidase [Methylibium sp.]|uniref:M23 family metallopeptidase n=1 Tax=Methylibium sp. TaxID=2067992 RepID=UPI00185CBDF8|nr:M23 family metallopeptidase [Methylibium sp.]MBA3598864.1 M23 family metallopeptidase [Methylibium sp.]
MQIIVTDSGLGGARVLSLRGRHVLGMILAAALAIVLLAATAYPFVFSSALPTGSPLTNAMARLDPREDKSAQRDRYLRENLDAMAAKLGELQAKLMRLDAVGERVSGLAGLKPEDFEGLDKLPAPGGAASAAAPGSGGPYLPMASPSLTQLGRELALIDEQADRSNDIFTLAESRLLETRLLALMVPSSAPVPGPIGSGFGFRSDPFTGRGALHTGLDFPVNTGTPIQAAAGGVVRSAERHPQYGLLVELDHGNALVTRYAHASKLLVQAGDLVKRGQTIALVGSTGRSTGPHLHFEVMVEGVHQNPAKFLARSRSQIAARR